MEHAHSEHPESHRTPDGHLHDHETKDVNIRGVLISAVILLATTVFTMIGIAVIMRSFYSAREQRAEAARPARYDDLTGQFPDPRLQGNPTTDMVKLRKEATEAVSRYEWVAADRVARIPLDRALDIVAARGLPTRGQAKAEAPKAEAPKPEAPKAETPKAEAPKPEAPKAEAPKAEAPKAEAPKPEADSPTPATPPPSAPEEPKKAP